MIAEFSVFPMGGKGTGMSGPLARVLRVVDDSGLDYRLGPMCTVVEGGWDEVMALVKRCHHLMLRGHARVITSIKVDDRKGARGRMKGKVRTLQAKAGRPLKV